MAVLKAVRRVGLKVSLKVAEVDPRKEKERIVAEKRAKKLALSKQVEDSFRSMQNNV